MTEAEWRNAVIPQLLLDFARDSVSPRKLRLFGVACCWRAVRRLEPSLIDALKTAEGYADGMVKRSVMVRTGRKVREASGFDPWHRPSGRSLVSQAVGAVCQPGISYEPINVLSWLLDEGVFPPHEFQQEQSEQTNFLRDIFGNPFRPVSFDPAWRTSTAVALARQMYDARDFGAMPILADALQDAGCDNEDVLTHCRAVDGVHVRGCWVVDLVLGKS
jgi:hypothetical protein